MTRAVFERKVWSGCRNGEKAGERRLGHEARTHASHARITLMALYAFRIGKKKTTVISLTESQQKRLAKVLNDSIRDILTFTAKNITKILFIYVPFLPCRIQFNEFLILNSTEIRRLNLLPHFCRPLDRSFRITRQKCDTD